MSLWNRGQTDVKIHTFGEKDRPVVIMLPGSFCNADTMADIIKRLETEFYILAVDYSGQYAGSEKPFSSRSGEAGEIIDIIKKQKYMGMHEDMAREKLIDECGDYCWYLVEVCTGYDFDFDNLVQHNHFRTIQKGSNEYNDSIENHAICLMDRSVSLYRHPGFKATIVGSAVYMVGQIILRLGVTLEDVLEHNIDKLRKRYPEGFSADRSNVRYEQ
jgi:NTP pyrophosphatase (non-canonical NTP hydrolase)